MKQRGGVHNWQASEASETQTGAYKFELLRYIYSVADQPQTKCYLMQWDRYAAGQMQLLGPRGNL